jgi:hypothetical protein
MQGPAGSEPAVRRRRRTMLTFALAFTFLAVSGIVAWQLVNEKTDAAASFDDCAVTGAAGGARVTPPHVRVNVFNATERTGLARSVASQLKRRGYAVKNVANDPMRARIPGTAVIRYGRSGTAAAKLLAAQIPHVKLARDKRRAGVIDLVLGERFAALAPPPPGCGPG